MARWRAGLVCVASGGARNTSAPVFSSGERHIADHRTGLAGATSRPRKDLIADLNILRQLISDNAWRAELQRIVDPVQGGTLVICSNPVCVVPLLVEGTTQSHLFFACSNSISPIQPPADSVFEILGKVGRVDHEAGRMRLSRIGDVPVVIPSKYCNSGWMRMVCRFCPGDRSKRDFTISSLLPA